MRRCVLVLLIGLGAAFPAFAGALDDLKAGAAALGKHDSETAVRLLAGAIDSGALARDDLAAAYDYRGRALYAGRDFDGALADFDRAIRLKGDFAEAYFDRAEAHFAAQDFERALPDYGMAVRLRPTYARAYLYRGDTYFAMRQYAEAVPDYDKAIELDPKLPNAYLYRGDAFLNLGRFTNAIVDFGTAIALQPDYALAYRQRGRAHAALSEVDEALADYAQSIRYDQRAFFTYQDRGFLYLQAGQYDKAVADLDTSLEMADGVPASWIIRGLAKLYGGRPADAAKDFARAVAVKPTDAYATLWLHVARAHAGEPDREEFAGNADQLDVFEWPYPVVAFYLGRGGEKDLRNATTLSDSEAVREARRCDAALFIGEYRLGRKQPGEAKRLFREAAIACSPQALQSTAAQVELRWLNTQVSRSDRQIK